MVSLRERFDWIASSMTSRRGRAVAILGIAVMAASVSIGCRNAPMTNLTRLVEARRLAADVLVQFTKSADAGNRAVMADTDEASAAFVREAEEATAAVLRDTDALGPMLRDLGYSKETDLLEEFSRRFSEYRALDKGILELAVENTNLKAQRLSFGPVQEAADAFRDSLEAPPRTDGTLWGGPSRRARESDQRPHTEGGAPFGKGRRNPPRGGAVGGLKTPAPRPAPPRLG